MAAAGASVVLKAVRRISVRFCPFESNVRATREFLVLVGSEKARSTNMNCEVTVEARHDRSPPLVQVTFADGENLVMKGANLSSQEMLSALKSRCTARDPQAKAGGRK
ncbi:large ribosomal subunit protein mL53 [Denticeps clupeoides]|uniref:Large ribosomal subunit protein mL53 n=1 Tax=Denticeps clupeoides TaxID=299321 RepID=A0AAY4C988_9TELE|nr:39S ribosomal protein L53, mitochondrial [Denticeps clupeoides]